MNTVKSTFNFNSSLNIAVRYRLWAFFPLIVLAIDIVNFPFIFHTSFQNSVPQLEELLEESSSYLGRYKGHKIYVSFDDLSEDTSQQMISPEKRNTRGLVFGHYLVHQGVASQTGAVGRAISNQLARQSPGLEIKFDQFLKQTAHSSTGDSLIFKVEENKGNQCQECEYQYYFAVLVSDINSQETVLINELAQGFQKTFASAEQLQLNSLVVTTVALDPQYNNSLSAKDFFEVLFEAMQQSKYPQQVYLSFYKRWPSYFRDIITTGLNHVWDEKANRDGNFSDDLYRIDLRLSMIFLCLCLLICSAKTSLTLKNFLIISIAYLGIVHGGFKALELFVSDFDSDLKLISIILVQFIVAIGFPSFVNWDPTDLFSNNKGGD